ncbi:MAG: cupin domain-containing protein [Smithella sp.]
MFYKANQSEYKIVLPGIEFKTLVYGEKTLFTEFRMDAGSVLPQHAHIHEQTGYLIEGKFRLTIGGQVFEVEKGDCWSIPSNMEHGAEILKDSVAIEVFSPVRDEYIPHKVK